MIERRDAVRARLDEAGIDALLVTKPVNVRYLSGFSGSNAQLLIGGVDRFFTDPRYEEQSARECADLERIVYSPGPTGAGMVTALAEAAREEGWARLGVEAEHVTLALASRLIDALDDIALVETTSVIEPLRRVKDEREIEAMRRACSFADTALSEVIGTLSEGVTEVGLAAALEQAMRRHGSDGLSFDTIVAFGEQAAEPHHRPTARALRAGDMIKIDFGATADGYHSDMTRTIAFGEPSSEMRAVYDLVRAAQEAGLAAVRAGVTCGDVDAAARDVLVARGYDFGHGTGHGIGLEVHESPSVRKGATDVLESGTVITVEPGIYLPGTGGVRIEDTVVVREHGCDILTRSTKELVKV